MSNREIQTFPYTFGNQGILLKSAADEVPLTAYSGLFNLFTDRENQLTARRGFARIGGVPSRAPSPNGYISTATNQYRYARAGTEWCRATVGGDYAAIATGLSSTEKDGLTAVNTLNDLPFVFYADGTKFIKDYGTGNATNVGLATPATTLSLAFNTGGTTTTIENFSGGIGAWSSSVLSGTGSVTQTLTTGSSGNGISIAPSAASLTTRTKKNITLNMGSSDELTVQLSLKIPTDANMVNLDRVVLQFSIGDTTFATRYEKSLAAHPMQKTTYTTVTPDDLPDTQKVWQHNIDYQTSNRTDYQKKVVTFSPADIPPGTGVFNVVRVKKNEFARVGISEQTDPNLNWEDVKAVGIEVITNTGGGTTVVVDEIIYRTEGHISGENIAYTFTYYDSVTDTESDYADTVDVPNPPGAHGDSFAITFSDSPPTNATHRRLYRIGNTVEQFQKVIDIAIGTTTYTDDAPDADLDSTVILQTDNQAPSGVPRGVCAFDNRLFIWGIAGEPPNKLRFSKRNKLENFPTDYWIPVGTGSEQIVRLEEFNGELFVFTKTQVYRVIGTDEFTYRAISTTFMHGLASYTGVAKGPNSMWMASDDGIYEIPSGKRISEAVNPVWRGQEVGNMPPFIKDKQKYIALGYINQKVFVSYANAEPDVPDEANCVILCYDVGYERWHFYGYGVKEFFLEPADSIIGKDQMLLGGVITVENGGAGNYMHQLETGTTDECVGGFTGMYCSVRTKELDMGAADREKQFIDLVVDCNTQGGTFTVSYVLDGSTDDPDFTSNILGTITTNGRGQVILPFPNQYGASMMGKRLQLQIEGYSPLAADDYNTQVIFYKLMPRFLMEPPWRKDHVTDWSDEGTPDEKIWRELHIEYDSEGYAPAFTLDVDGTDVYTFSGTASTARKKFYYSFPVTSDVRGTKIRLKVSPSRARSIKIYDYKFISIPEANPVTTFETAWSDEGQPNVFKRFRKVIVEVDNQNSGTITVTPDIDGVAQTPFNVTASGRQETVYSFPVDTTGYLWRIRVTTTTTMKFYSARVEALPDPTHGTTYESAWGLQGTQNRKRFRDIILDIDTLGSNVSVTPWIDGEALTPFTVNTPTRMVQVLALPVDTTGILCRLTTSGGSFHTVYYHQFTYSEEPQFSDVKETLWTDEGYPYDKLWKHVTMDVDTGGQTVTAYLWLDGAINQSWSVNTSTRALLTHSLGQNVIGKLGRITITGADTQLFSAKFSVDPEPPDVTTADSYEQTFGYDGWKILKRLYAAIKAPSTVTIAVYADEVLRDTVTVQSNLGTGYAKVRIDLNSAIKGKLFRFVFTSSSSFKLYWEKSQVEMKGLNANDGWALYKFAPPQTF